MQTTVEPAEAGFDATRLGRISHWAEHYIARGNLPCAMTLVARRGEIVFIDARGFSNTASGEAITFDHRFRIFSMTKPITAVATMMLVEEARLRLDDPVSHYIPAFADTSVLRKPDGPIEDTTALKTPLTLHHLLTHWSCAYFDRTVKRFCFCL